MKKRIVIPVFIGILFAIIGGWIGLQTTPKEKSPSMIAGEKNRTITQVPTLSVSLPHSLTIKKIGVRADVESVGMDTKGAMDIPKQDMNVAWYNLGAKPGEQGSAVVAGHLDTKSGGPAVFWDLNKLTKGDTIEVTDVNGKTRIFVVTHQETFDFEKVPLQDIFANADGKHLNLITCEGTFNRSKKNYTKRLVVYAEMK